MACPNIGSGALPRLGRSSLRHNSGGVRANQTRESAQEMGLTPPPQSQLNSLRTNFLLLLLLLRIPQKQKGSVASPRLASFCGSLTPAPPLLGNGYRGRAGTRRAARAGHPPTSRPPGAEIHGIHVQFWAALLPCPVCWC